MSSPRLLVVVGPTASGKSTLAAELGARLPGEVVSADSVQVYRYFDIGSGKAGAEELARCPHHLLDIVDPLTHFEAAQFAEAAGAAIAGIHARGKLPIVCGGTFLWIRALLFGLAEAPPGDEKIRARHKRMAEEKGRDSVHEALRKVDPKSAARLHPNDLLRVSRALEVFEITGKRLSDLQAEHGFAKKRYNVRFLQLAWEKDAYEARLRARICAMLAGGWRQEVEELLRRGYRESRAMQAIGYKQMLDAIDGKLAEDELEDAIVKVTRIFARRQRTWLRDEEVASFPAEHLENGAALDALSAELRDF